MKYSRKQIGVIFLCICLIGVALCGAGLYQNKLERDKINAARKQYEVTYSPEDTYTVCLYISGADLESYGSAGTDILKSINNTKLPEGVTVLIQAGGSTEWHHKDMANGAVRRFKADKKSRLKLMEDITPANMADGDTLSDFLSWCDKEAPADHRVLLLWGHGMGSAGGMLVDELNTGDVITLTELRRALEKAYPDCENAPFELAGIMECLAQNIDTAAAFEGYAEYVAASEEIFATREWSISNWLDDLTYFRGMDGKAMGESLCDALKNNTYVTAVSVLDMEKLPALIEAYDNVGKEALEKQNEDSAFISVFRDAAERSIQFENFPTIPNTMVDMGGLLNNLKPELESADKAEKALSECVVYFKGTGLYENISGLSCYFPFGDYHMEGRDYYSQDACSPAFKEFYRQAEQYDSPKAK